MVLYCFLVVDCRGAVRSASLLASCGLETETAGHIAAFSPLLSAFAPPDASLVKKEQSSSCSPHPRSAAIETAHNFRKAYNNTEEMGGQMRPTVWGREGSPQAPVMVMVMVIVVMMMMTMVMMATMVVMTLAMLTMMMMRAHSILAQAAKSEISEASIPCGLHVPHEECIHLSGALQELVKAINGGPVSQALAKGGVFRDDLCSKPKVASYGEFEVPETLESRIAPSNITSLFSPHHQRKKVLWSHEFQDVAGCHKQCVVSPMTSASR